MFGSQRMLPASLGFPADAPTGSPQETSKKKGAHSLTSPFKKKFLSILEKINSLKGGYKEPSRPHSKPKSGGLHHSRQLPQHGPAVARPGRGTALDLAEDSELRCPPNRPPLPLIPPLPPPPLLPSAAVGSATATVAAGSPRDDTGGGDVGAILRHCQLQSGTSNSFVGAVPVVTLEGLHRGLYGTQHAVFVLPVGDDTPNADPSPHSIKHCSSELSHSVQQRIASESADATSGGGLLLPHSLSGGTSRDPSFSQAFCKTLWQSLEGPAAQYGGGVDGGGAGSSLPAPLCATTTGAVTLRGAAAGGGGAAVGGTAPIAVANGTCSADASHPPAPPTLSYSLGNMWNVVEPPPAREVLMRGLTGSGSCGAWVVTKPTAATAGLGLGAAPVAKPGETCPRVATADVVPPAYDIPECRGSAVAVPVRVALQDVVAAAEAAGASAPLSPFAGITLVSNVHPQLSSREAMAAADMAPAGKAASAANALHAPWRAVGIAGIPPTRGSVAAAAAVAGKADNGLDGADDYAIVGELEVDADDVREGDVTAAAAAARSSAAAATAAAPRSALRAYPLHPHPQVQKLHRHDPSPVLCGGAGGTVGGGDLARGLQPHARAHVRSADSSSSMSPAANAVSRPDMQYPAEEHAGTRSTDVASSVAAVAAACLSNDLYGPPASASSIGDSRGSSSTGYFTPAAADAAAGAGGDRSRGSSATSFLSVKPCVLPVASPLDTPLKIIGSIAEAARRVPPREGAGKSSGGGGGTASPPPMLAMAEALTTASVTATAAATTKAAKTASTATSSPAGATNSSAAATAAAAAMSLKPVFMSGAMSSVMGSSCYEQLRTVLQSLLSGNPGLQLMLGDVARSALAGLVLAHEQLLACPRLMVGAPLPLPGRSTGVGGGGFDNGAGNLLDDFLLLRATSCYLDQRHSVGGAPAAAGAPPLLPALFLYFIRPYVEATAAALGVAAAGGAVNSVTGNGALPPRPPPPPPLSPPPLTSLRSTSGCPLESSYLLNASAGGGEGCAGGRGRRSISESESPTLSSLFGPSGRANRVRPGGIGLAAVTSASPTLSPSAASGAATGNGGGDDAGSFDAQPRRLAPHRSGRGSGSCPLGPRISAPKFCKAPPPPPPPPAYGGLPATAVAASAAPAAADPEGFSSQIRFEQMALAHVPVAMMVMSLEGRVLWQNDRSVAYFGNAVGLPVPTPGLGPADPEHSLQRIFSYDKPALESMWEAVRSGKAWSGLVCMPPQLDLSQLLEGPPATSPRSHRAPPGPGPGPATVRRGPLPTAASGAECGGGNGGPAIAGCTAAGGVDSTVDTDIVGLLQQLYRPCRVTDPQAGSAAPAVPASNAAGPVPAGQGRGTPDMVPHATASGSSSGDSTAAAAAEFGWVAVDGVGGSGGRALASLPCNISAPTFRDVGCPLPSGHEAEVGGGSRAAAAARGRFAARNSSNACPTYASASPYGTSPAGAAASHHLLCTSSSAAAVTSCRTRIHRSESLAQTELALVGSYRAMRLAASAASQGLLGAAAPKPLACSGGAGGGGGGVSGGSWSFSSGDWLQYCSPRNAGAPSPNEAASVPAPVAVAVAGERPLSCSTAGAMSLHMAGSFPDSHGGNRGGDGGGAERSLASIGGSGGGTSCSPYGAAAATGAAHWLTGTLPHTASGAAAAAATTAAAALLPPLARSPPYIGACCWHEIQANLILDPVTGDSNLILVCHDVTTYVQAELEIRQVLDAEHRILEEVFPRHVLEVMTSAKRRTFAAVSVAAAAPAPTYAGCPPSLARSFSLPCCCAAGGAAAAGGLPSFNGRTASPSGHAAGDAGATAADAISAATASDCASGQNCGSARSPALEATAAAAASTSPPPAVAAAAAAAPGGASRYDGCVHMAPLLPSLEAGGGNRSSESSLLAHLATTSASAGGIGGGSCGAEHRNANTHLGTLCSLSSFNYSSCTHGGMYGSCDDRASYSCFSQQQRLDGDNAFRAFDGVGGYGSVSGYGAYAPASAPGAAGVAAAAPPPPPPRPLLPPAALTSCAYGSSFSQSVSSQLAPICCLGGGGGDASMCTAQHYMARSHEEVTVLFADIASFTRMCGQVPPHIVMAFLNDLFTIFDQLVEKHRVYKVETIGDCYMLCGGLVEEDAEGFRSVTKSVDPLHAHKVFGCAVDMLAAAQRVALPGACRAPVQLRVGLHSGPVMSGVVGRKMPRFCLFGDTVNTASRMETTGVPGSIHISAATMSRLGRSPAENGFTPTGGVTVKGKGLMFTYLYDPLGVAAQTIAARRPPPPSGAESATELMTSVAAPPTHGAGGGAITTVAPLGHQPAARLKSKAAAQAADGGRGDCLDAAAVPLPPPSVPSQ